MVELRTCAATQEDELMTKKISVTWPSYTRSISTLQLDKFLQKYGLTKSNSVLELVSRATWNDTMI